LSYWGEVKKIISRF